ncbi:MAG: adenylyltransferase/cytidyltransferase family protein [Dehalococcoidia bacterium]|nr:adenylyltransferase/cytidyltransferase family protein [Dehalococcoidia bacterium]
MTSARYGMIHGRFQPFHNGHLEYLKLALERCDTLIVGITNPDPMQTREDSASEHRHLAESNPFTFFERLLMVRDTLVEERIALDRVVVTPFPVNLPDRWRYYLPPGVTCYLRVFSAWEQSKAGRLADHGYAVEILQPGAIKEVEATEVRRRLREGENWRELVPPAVARVVAARPG